VDRGIRRTGRWRGATAVALTCAGAGAALGRPGLVVAAAVGVAVVAHAGAASPPALDVALERSLSTTAPAPGERVAVTVAVTNEGATPLADLRVIDGVPPALAVTEGSPRHGTALRPGKTDRFTYVVEARRGRHAFEPSLAVARDPSGAAERRREVEAGGELRCVPPLPDPVAVPLARVAAGVVGRTAAAGGGPGVEFHSVREYRRGDPLARVDWNRAARAGDLATVEFRRERAATVVALIDARAAAYVAPTPDGDPAVERGISAAGAVFGGRRARGDRVGIAALAPRECWLEPAGGAAHRERARDLLATHSALAPTPPGEPYFGTLELRRLRRRLPAGAQVVFCTPLADEYPVRVARRLAAAGHPVTVVSPDPTAGGPGAPGTPSSVGLRRAAVERTLRCSRLRSAGVPVVDWGTEPLATAVESAARRWSR